jgi:hypothetical protein
VTYESLYSKKIHCRIPEDGGIMFIRNVGIYDTYPYRVTTQKTCPPYGNIRYVAKLKLKLSHYTLRRRLRGEEV